MKIIIGIKNMIFEDALKALASINLVQRKKYYVGHGNSQKSFRKYSENLDLSKK